MKLYYAIALLMLAANARAVEMSATSSKAFDEHVVKVEAALEARAKSGSPLQLAPELKPNMKNVVVKASQERNPREIDHAFLHDWVAGTFIPGVTMEEVNLVLGNFDEHKNYYAPEVMEAKMVRREGDITYSTLRLKKKKIITVILKGEYRTRTVRLDSKRAYKMVASTRIREVDRPGTKEEREKELNESYGFLWRMNSYWAIEERDGGVYLEIRSVTMSRDVPTALGWVITPMIKNLPRESLAFTLERTREAVLNFKQGKGCCAR